MEIDRSVADVVLFNTCSVREQAENKVLSRIGELGVEKNEGRQVVIGMLGCLPEREGKRLLRKYPQIDFICGPSELDRLPTLLQNTMLTEKLVMQREQLFKGIDLGGPVALSAADDNLELLDLSRVYDPDFRQSNQGGLPMFGLLVGVTSFVRTVLCQIQEVLKFIAHPIRLVEECENL